VESFIMKMLLPLLLLLLPLLIIDHYQPIPSKTQAIYCIIIVLLSIFITWWLTKRMGRGACKRKLIEDADNMQMQVEVVTVKTSRAIKREDPEDFGVAYYLDVIENGKRTIPKPQPKTLLFKASLVTKMLLFPQLPGGIQ
jgi:hypothetical protein